MIPNFRDTQEALAFGRSATKGDIEKLKLIYRMLITNVERIKASFGNSIESLDTRMEFAVMAQYMREALEAAGEEIL